MSLDFNINRSHESSAAGGAAARVFANQASEQTELALIFCWRNETGRIEGDLCIVQAKAATSQR